MYGLDIYEQFPLTRSKGFLINTPYEEGDAALRRGDSYSFTHNGATYFCVYDGDDWRLVHERLDGAAGDLDHNVVTIL